MKQTGMLGEATGPSHQHAGPDILDAPDAPDDNAARVWLAATVDTIAGFLPDNEVACTLRLVCRATAQQFADRAIVRPAQPVPRWCFASECRRVCRGLTLAKRQQLLCPIAASGDVANLEAAVTETGCPLTMDALKAAAEAGELGMCQWLMRPGRIALDPISPANTAVAAAFGGQGHVVDWCLEQGAGAQSIIGAALRKGHEGLAWRLLEAHPSAWGPQTLCAATEGCSLAGLQRVWERTYPTGAGGAQLDATTGTDALTAAVRSPTADWEAKCGFLLQKGCRLAEDASGWVLGSRFLSGSAAVERLAWLQARGVGLTEDPYELSQLWVHVVQKKDDAALVSYLLERGLKPEPALIYELARSAEVIEALAATPGREAEALIGMTYSAVEAGSLAGLSWLVETYGAEAIGGFTPELFRCAARSGSVELMAWLLARGCEVDERAWVAARVSGCEAALELLSERGCPKPAGHGLYLDAAYKGDLRTMAVLRRLGFPFSQNGGQELFKRIASDVPDVKRALAALAWLCANGCSIDWDEAEQGGRERSERGRDGRAEVLAWLAEQRQGICSP